MAGRRKMLAVDVAALGWDLLERAERLSLGDLRFRPLESVFPALTCTAQASFRTAAPRGVHGIAANGFFDRRLRRTFFWEQSAALVGGPRMWDRFRAAGGRVALLFWQQSLGESADRVLSPRPVHRHHGGIIFDCQSRPLRWSAELERRIGRRFPLSRYWGPLAGAASSEWIVRATIETMRLGDDAPELILSYLPHLDYDLQRFGPAHPRAVRALAAVLRWLARLRAAAAECGYEVLYFGDYAMAAVTAAPVFPNRALRAAGLLEVRNVRGRAYPDLFGSATFAVCDHEVALVYGRDAACAARAREVLAGLPGVAEMTPNESAGGDGAPDFLLTAAEGRWFAYPWWETRGEAPDYAAHVDIHNKPGYDPCELFFGFPPPRVSQDSAQIRGTHGRAGPARRAAWTSSASLKPEAGDLVGLAAALRGWLEEALP